MSVKYKLHIDTKLYVSRVFRRYAEYVWKEVEICLSISVALVERIG
jgi:hypothetical protein